LSPRFFRQSQRFEGLARQFLAAGQRPQRRRICLLRSRLVVSPVPVLMIAAHDSVPAYFIPHKVWHAKAKRLWESSCDNRQKNTRPLWGVHPICDFREAKGFLRGVGIRCVRLIQHVPHFAGKSRRRIRFGQELGSGLKHSGMRNGGVRVA